MIETFTLSPSVRLRCVPDSRFKQGCFSLQLLRPMCREEAALNALLPAVLLRGTRNHPDLRSITLRLDDLYGASAGTLVRRVGDWQTTGLYCGFIEDRFAMAGDAVLAPMLSFLRQLLLEPLTENGIFCADFVESEQKNLIAAIEASLNDKRAYAMEQLIRSMCPQDPFGLPRLGTVEEVERVTAQSLWDHYQRILRESPIELLYVGSAPAEGVRDMAAQMLRGLSRQPIALPPQTPLQAGPPQDLTQTMDVRQGKLCMGFVTPVTVRDEEFVAMQLLNSIFGGGMTSKLFLELREKQSLCYAVSSGFHGSKGLLTVSAGIDSAMKDRARQEILAQLEACRQGRITEEEMTAARESLRSSLLAIQDSPGAMESYYATAALSGHSLTPQRYLEKVEQVTKDQVVAAAKTLTAHSTFFLKGADQ